MDRKESKRFEVVESEAGVLRYVPQLAHATLGMRPYHIHHMVNQLCHKVNLLLQYDVYRNFNDIYVTIYNFFRTYGLPYI